MSHIAIYEIILRIGYIMTQIALQRSFVNGPLPVYGLHFACSQQRHRGVLVKLNNQRCQYAGRFYHRRPRRRSLDTASQFGYKTMIPPLGEAMSPDESELVQVQWMMLERRYW